MAALLITGRDYGAPEMLTAVSNIISAIGIRQAAL
jgi:hypothetical protein